jgi:hypothetical protein
MKTDPRSAVSVTSLSTISTMADDAASALPFPLLDKR